jgi:hypothetical protein
MSMSYIRVIGRIVVNGNAWGISVCAVTIALACTVSMYKGLQTELGRQDWFVAL